MDKIKIILDTDIGDYIDDTLALALALESDEIDIVGITTVFKNTIARAKIAKAILAQYHSENIKVYAGIGLPLNNSVNLNEIPSQFQSLTATDMLVEQVHAVDFIIETIKCNPKVIIVAIGPLTNIAVAYLKAPHIMKNAKIIAMGGIFKEAFSEWNILCDPEAAKLVVESEMSVKMVGLDVTKQCVLTREQFIEFQKNKRDEVQFIVNCSDNWFKHNGTTVAIHDPLIIAYLLDNELLKFETADIRVQTEGKFTRGMTLSKTNPFMKQKIQTNVQIAVDVKVQDVIELFMKRILG